MFLVFDPDTSGPSDLFFAFVYGISVIRVSVILGLTVLFVLLLVRTLLVHQTFLFFFCFHVFRQYWAVSVINLVDVSVILF